MSKFKAGETYRTRNQSIAKIYATDDETKQGIYGAIADGNGWEAMTWDKDGKFSLHRTDSAWDLMPETEYWYCVAYINSNGFTIMRTFNTESGRNDLASTLVGDVKTFELEKR